MHELKTWAWSIALEMDEHIHGWQFWHDWISFINLDEMNGCVGTYLDAIHSFILNEVGIASNFKYLILLPYEVSSGVHLSRKCYVK